MLTRALIDIMEDRPPTAELPILFTDLNAADIESAAGRYAVDRVGTVTLAVRDKRLFARIDRGIEYPAIPVGDGQMYVPGLDVWIGFPGDARTSRRFERMSWLSIFLVSEGRRAP